MAESKAQDALHIRTLGGLTIQRNGKIVSGFASRKAEALLVYLALEPRPHPREVLADLLWDDRPQRQAMANLRVVLASLRKEVGSFVVLTRQMAAIRDGAHVWLDAEVLTRTVAQFQEDAAPGTAQALEEALALYVGDFLQGYSLPDARGWEAWTVTSRERLHNVAVAGFELLGSNYLVEGEFGKAITIARQFLEVDPLSEVGQRQLMEALARSDRRREALALYERSRQLLWTELGLEPSPATQALAAAIQQDTLGGQAPIPLGHTTAHRHFLPAVATPLIGRQVEMEEVVGLLVDSARLVTIVGPGGIGKTRLAVGVAHELTSQLADGAAFVDLTRVSSSDGIVAAIMDGLQMTVEGFGAPAPELQLLDYLRDKAALLVLDNFEHLMEGVGLLTKITESTEHIKLLVTSREALNLHVEHVYPLRGLTLSEWDNVEDAELDAAMQLFLFHARRSRPSFILKPEHLEPLRSLMRLVEGMPLAVILAAGWLEVLRPAEIVTEMAKSLDFLAATYGDLPERQRSMRAVFQATWERLASEDQSVFAALSVFRGGFTLEAAREVALATPHELRRLVHRSLVTRSDDGRFAVHELLRQFAAEKLAASPEAAAVHERHSAYYCRFLGEQDPLLKSAQSEQAAAAIGLEFENARAAWNWAADNRRLFLLEPAITIGFYCASEGRPAAAAALFQRAVDNFEVTTVPAELRVQAFLLAGLGAFVYVRGASVEQRKALHQGAQERLEAAAALGEDVRYEEAFNLSILGQTLVVDEFRRARAMLERSLSLFRELDKTYEMAAVCGYLAVTYAQEGNYAQAYQYEREALQLWEVAGQPQFAYRSQLRLGRIMTDLGQREEGVAAMRQAVAEFEGAGKQHMVANGELELGIALTYIGEFEEAQALIETALAYYRRMGLSRVSEGIQMNWCVAAIHLGAFDEVWRLSRLMYIRFSELQFTSMMGTAAWIQGCAALARGDGDEAARVLVESIEALRSVEQREALGWALAAAACAAHLNGSVIEARQMALEALQLARELRVLTSASVILPVIALILAEAANEKRALELYELASRDPYVANSRWFEHVIGHRLEAVTGKALTDMLALAPEEQAEADLWQTVDEVESELLRLISVSNGALGVEPGSSKLPRRYV